MAESYKLGVNSYIVKPMDFEEFGQSVGLLGRYWLHFNHTPKRSFNRMTNALNILVVEDSPDDAELMLRELRHAGFEPIGNGWRRKRSIWRKSRKCRTSFYPTMRCRVHRLARGQLLRESGLKIPFILVSGTVGEDIAVEAMKGGATDYLLKDRIARLGNAVRRALEQTTATPPARAGGRRVARKRGKIPPIG